MHPAYSVILFTTASGAGYGLLFCLSLASMVKATPAHWACGLIGLGLALGLITMGLLSSTAHLGHPERAWRAFSQWRSSWLSREGVLAVLTYLPSGLLGVAWVFFETTGGMMSPIALLTAIAAAATVYSTAMIYASLRTIPAWHQPLTMPNYLLLALASGALLFNLVLSLFQPMPSWSIVTTIAILVAAAMLKRSYWQAIDHHQPRYTVEDATGLGSMGKVRTLEPAHTQPNFVMREMGYAVGRKHARKLRLIAAVLAFLIPILCLLAILAFGSNGEIVLIVLALLSMAAGLVIERWLFFAEAQHLSMLYYGLDAA